MILKTEIRYSFSDFCMRIALKRSEINFKAYAKQVLEDVAVPFLQNLEEGIDGTIFMENDVKIHLGFAKEVRKQQKILRFSKGWPPSSPDLNPIEKVWRWMKARITEMKPFPMIIDELKAAVQALWDEMDPCMFIRHIEATPQKLQKVIKQCGYATKY